MLVVYVILKWIPLLPTYISMRNLSNEDGHNNARKRGGRVRNRHQCAGIVRCNVDVVREQPTEHATDRGNADRHHYVCSGSILPGKGAAAHGGNRLRHSIIIESRWFSKFVMNALFLKRMLFLCTLDIKIQLRNILTRTIYTNLRGRSLFVNNE